MNASVEISSSLINLRPVKTSSPACLKLGPTCRAYLLRRRRRVNQKPKKAHKPKSIMPGMASSAWNPTFSPPQVRKCGESFSRGKIKISNHSDWETKQGGGGNLNNFRIYFRKHNHLTTRRRRTPWANDVVRSARNETEMDFRLPGQMTDTVHGRHDDKSFSWYSGNLPNLPLHHLWTKSGPLSLNG